jgi:hypothetical protein
MKHTIRTLLATLFLALSVIAIPAWAMSLDEAKAKGIVGETPTGYIASVKPTADQDVIKLINEINTKRRAAFTESAANAGVTLDIIEIRISQRLYELAPKGTYLQTPNGQWQQK